MELKGLKFKFLQKIIKKLKWKQNKKIINEVERE